jgi:hypothetical protein
MHRGRTVELSRDEHGKLGMGFRRLNNARSGPIRIVQIAPGSPVDESPFLEVGDVFFAVNGQDITMLDNCEVSALIQGRAHDRIALHLFSAQSTPLRRFTSASTEATTQIRSDPTKEATTQTQLDPTKEATTQTQLDPTKEATTQTQLDPTKEATTQTQLDPSKEATTQTQLDRSSKHCRGCGILFKEGFPEAYQLGEKVKYLLPVIDAETQMQNDVIRQQFELIMRQRVQLWDAHNLAEASKKLEVMMATTNLGLRATVQQLMTRVPKDRRQAWRSKMRHNLKRGSLSPEQQRMRLRFKANKYGEWKKMMGDKHGIFFKKSFAAFLQSAP